jgi:hypothetical protein
MRTRWFLRTQYDITRNSSPANGLPDPIAWRWTGGCAALASASADAIDVWRTRVLVHAPHERQLGDQRPLIDVIRTAIRVAARVGCEPLAARRGMPGAARSAATSNVTLPACGQASALRVRILSD